MDHFRIRFGENSLSIYSRWNAEMIFMILNHYSRNHFCAVLAKMACAFIQIARYPNPCQSSVHICGSLFGSLQAIESMKQKGYSVNWKDSRKYIVFTNQEGKKARDSNLQRTYNLPVGKDELTEFFKKKSLTKKKGHSMKHRRG